MGSHAISSCYYENIFKNVFDACLDRLRYLFDEFDKIIVSFSGGKDSTVIFNMAMIVAKEKQVAFDCDIFGSGSRMASSCRLHQNCYANPEVEPHWLQVPIRLFNATSSSKQWLHCWGEGEQWMREKEDIAIKENKYGVDRFVAFFFLNILIIIFLTKALLWSGSMSRGIAQQKRCAFAMIEHISTFHGESCIIEIWALHFLSLV